MLKYIFALSLTLTSVALAAPPAPQVVTLDDVVKKVSTENYNVYSNALRVYQARESVQVARMNLLPKLNIWRLAGAAVEVVLGGYSGNGVAVAAGVLTVIDDIAPFLVPANWFRVKESKLLYLADQEGYRALWANELMSAKALYVHLLLDASLLAHIEESKRELAELLTIVRSRELLGGAPQGASRDIEIRTLALQEDKRALEALLAEEESLLAYMMAYPAEAMLRPAPLEMPDFENFQPLDYADFVFRAVDSAPELRQYDHFIAASDYVKSEVMYSFLGTSSMSRGVAGGVFDSLPAQSGLGFGTPASMRVVAAQKELLKAQRKGVEETIKRHLKLLVTNYNLDLENYAGLKRRALLTLEANAQLYERMRLGQNVDTLDLIEASRNHIQADTSFFAVKFRFITNEDKLARLIFHGDYTKKPIVIDDLKKETTTVSGRKGS